MTNLLNKFNQFSISGGSVKSKLELVLGFVFLVFVLMSLILAYHWLRYEGLRPRTIFLGIIYFAVSFILFIGAAYSLSLV